MQMGYLSTDSLKLKEKHLFKMSPEQLRILIFVVLSLVPNLQIFSAQISSNVSSSTFNDIDCGYKGPSLKDNEDDYDGGSGGGGNDQNGKPEFTPTGPHEFRWMVVVQITTPVTFRHNWCAGALINNQWVQLAIFHFLSTPYHLTKTYDK